MATEQEAAEASAEVFAEAFMKVLRERMYIELCTTNVNGHTAVQLQLMEQDPKTGQITPFLNMSRPLVLSTDPWSKPTFKVGW